MTISDKTIDKARLLKPSAFEQRTLSVNESKKIVLDSLGFPSQTTVHNTLRSRYNEPDSSISDLLNRYVNNRDAYSFDGVDDRGSLAFRAINPDRDIDIEWTQIGVSNLPPAPVSIVTQSFSATISSREFVLRWNGNDGGLQFSVGGLGFSNIIPCQDGRYRVTLQGNNFTLFYNGQPVRTRVFDRGTAREPTAALVIGARNSAGSFTEYANGSIFDIKINGVLWPIADRNQSIQLPQPSGLGAELITPSILENPVVKGSQWAYLGGGRWQYIGDGSFNELTFINPNLHPEQAFLEFEIESITGQLACVQASSAISRGVFNSIGIKRYFYTNKNEATTNGATVTFKRPAAGVITSCIIKNISFKPLLTTGTSLVTNGDFAAVGTWLVGANSEITNGELQINVASSTVTRQPVATENGKDYLITYTVKNITAGAVRVLLYGNGTHYIGSDRTVAGTYTEIARFNTSGGSFNNSVSIQAGHTGAANVVVDNVSVLEIPSLCNPLTLVNTNPDRWSEVPI